ncbi:hypothetical protein [Crossiella cryophila]|uniref:Uncharacterized protein n=1 Tax=Crossiella cryophila TaxID=43355 RepID=A0A7W7CHE2_9PSEU|nr:hypothetical protein [Crossiella cryophila]MBB4681224.1 hypothetical protein [Crossiella cryophila]
MRLPVISHPVRRHGSLHRILIPAAALRHTWLRSPFLTGYGKITASRADLLRLGALFRLAAISPHSAVHLPLRANQVPEDLAHWFTDHRPADLLIAHRDAGLRASAWPGLRASTRRRATQADRQTATTPAARPDPDPHSRDFSADRRLALSEHAETLLITAPGQGLHQVGDLLSQAGEAVATHRDIHRNGFALLSSLTPVLRGGGGAPDELEIDIYAREPIFHKARWAASATPPPA